MDNTNYYNDFVKRVQAAHDNYEHFSVKFDIACKAHEAGNDTAAAAANFCLVGMENAKKAALAARSDFEKAASKLLKFATLKPETNVAKILWAEHNEAMMIINQIIADEWGR